MKVGIGIVCIGPDYVTEFEKTFKPSVVAYAQRHGYELKLFTSFLDTRYTHPDCISFQKCLVPERMPECDVVIVMDADIWLSESAPPVPVPDTKIGIVDEVRQLTPREYGRMSFVSQPTQYYAEGGFSLNTDKILNTGFFVCRPALHAKFLRGVYDKHISKAPEHRRHFHYEQAAIGYELQVNNMFELLPNTWNSIALFYKFLGIQYPSVYGMHFAGLCAMTRERALKEYLTVQFQQRRLRWGIRK